VRYWPNMRETLAASMGAIELSDLRSHLARGAVIVVDRSLEPSLETIERWSKTKGSAWVSLIVQPFVLVSEDVDAATPAPN
jgi:hypothetical protein